VGIDKINTGSLAITGLSVLFFYVITPIILKRKLGRLGLLDLFS
jgi:hypothetical protein